jgi:hypothetical protein
MSYIKVPRSKSNHSTLERYNLNNFLYVSPTQKPGCSPSPNVENYTENYRENLGSFSIYAAVRSPYNYMGGRLAGVT